MSIISNIRSLFGAKNEKTAEGTKERTSHSIFGILELELSLVTILYMLLHS